MAEDDARLSPEASKEEMDHHTQQNGSNEERVVEGGGLVDFVMQEVQRQKMQLIDIEDTEADEQPPEVDRNREQNFFTSALSAIHKMNAEVDKSKRKQEQLHAKYGAQRYSDWQTEHAAQVLTPQEANLVAKYNKIV